MAQGTCEYVGCDRALYRADLCQGHSWQKYNKGSLTPLRAYVRKDTAPKEPCVLPVCEKSSCHGSPLCKDHRAIARQYALSDDDYAAMYLLGCQVCERSDVSLSVDHDHSCCAESKHSCGKCVRGLLCSDCNFLIGWLDKVPLDRSKVISNIAWYYEDYALWGAQEKAATGV